MKKLIVIAIVTAIALGISALSYADVTEANKEIAVSFGVTDVFGMKIWDDDYSQVLEDVAAGDPAFGSIHIYATSNHGVQWFIKAESTGMADFQQTQILPVIMWTFDGITGGPDEGTVQAPQGGFETDLQLTSAPQTIYTAASSEYTVTGLQVGCGFAIPTTVDTTTGIFEGTITLTMTK